MTVLAVSRHIPRDFDQEDRIAKAKELAGKFQFLLAAITSGVGTRLILSSDTPRAVETAEVFAQIMSGTVMKCREFNEDVHSEDRKALDLGHKVLSTALGQGHELVWLVTHQPLIESLFCRAAGKMLELRGHGDWFSVSEHYYGVHAVNAESRMAISYGKIGF